MDVTILKFLIYLSMATTIRAMFSNDDEKHADFLFEPETSVNNPELYECVMNSTTQYQSYINTIKKNLDAEQLLGRKPIKYNQFEPYCVHSCYFQSTGTWDGKGRLLNKERALDLFKLTKNPTEDLVAYVLVYGVPGQDDHVDQVAKPKKTGPVLVDLDDFPTGQYDSAINRGPGLTFAPSFFDDLKEEKEKQELEAKLSKNVKELFSKSIFDNVVQVCNDNLDHNVTDMCKKARSFWLCFNQNFMGTAFYILTKVNLTKSLPENDKYNVKMDGFDNFYDINEKFVYNNYKLKFMKTGNVIMGNTVLPKMEIQALPTMIKNEVDLWVKEKKYM